MAEAIVVIHGPMRTGKTFHAKAFAAHFGCDRIIEIDFEQHRTAEIGPGALILTNEWPRRVDRRRRDLVAEHLAGAQVFSIEQAREMIGVGPVSDIPPVTARASKPAEGTAPALPGTRQLAGNGLFNAFMRQGVKLPLRADAEYVGSVLDGHGDEIFVVDQNNELPDDRANAIAALIAAAVNDRAFVGGAA